MPHFIVEYAAPLQADIDPQTLVEDACGAGAQSGLFGPGDIKGRAHAVEHYLTAGTRQPFVHVDVRLLPGRTDAQKKDLAQRVFDALAARVPANVTLSVEVNELHAASYTKRL